MPSSRRRQLGSGKSGSHWTRRWREMDSDFRFRARRNQEISVSRWSSTDLVYGTVARISAEPSGRHAREQYRADKCPVYGEGPSREALEGRADRVALRCRKSWQNARKRAE